jgi:hypothetical protein
VIQVIGIMIAFYIITKMLHLLIDKSKEASPITLISAGITLLIAAYGIYSLLTSGAGLGRYLE